DNWATCDSLRPSCFKKHPFELFGMIDKWLKSEHVYTVRFAVGMLMVNYLDKNFDPEQMSKAAAACCDEYYVNMMVAWYFATALAKRYDHALLYLEQERLPLWVHNKTIQKAVESYRISAVQKAYLRTLRRR
ncbi:MAG: DNA alkylation repair protein, partial [Oscillospiraceae bacterium]|nr:DNA alkylation repair protein [Oscillospiraceae bacterium]